MFGIQQSPPPKKKEKKDTNNINDLASIQVGQPLLGMIDSIFFHNNLTIIKYKYQENMLAVVCHPLLCNK